jgi:hypothetical protein
MLNQLNISAMQNKDYEDDDYELYLVPRLHLSRLLWLAVAGLVMEMWGAYFIDHWGRRKGWW